MHPTTARLISDPEAIRAFLQSRLRRVHPWIKDVRRVILHPLGSVQAGRGVVRMIVQVRTADHKSQTINLFANYDTRGRSRIIYKFLVLLQRHGFDRGMFGAPQPLCYLPTSKLLVYESFPGRRVRDVLESGRLSIPKLNTIMRQSAGWLKKFHHLPTRIGEPRNLRLSKTFFSKLTKDHRQVTDAALPYINHGLAQPSKRVLVHGDPHLANCILGPKKSFAFIDFSESHLGLAAADIAMYLVHLDVALQPFFSRHTIAQAQRIFIEAYYGRPLRTLPPSTRRTIVAFELRTAAVFLRFTSDHHRQPSAQVAWMIQHFVNIISRGTDGLRRDQPEIILAT